MSFVIGPAARIRVGISIEVNLGASEAIFNISGSSVLGFVGANSAIINEGSFDISGSSVLDYIGQVTGGTVEVEGSFAIVSQSVLNYFAFNGADVSGPFDFFNEVIARPEIWFSQSYRTVDPFSGFENKSASQYFSYDPSNDPYPNKQDGVKLTYQPSVWGTANLRDQARKGIHVNGTDTYLFIWDDWWGPEWRRVSRGGVIVDGVAYSQKVWQFAFEQTSKMFGEDGIYWEINCGFLTLPEEYTHYRGIRAYRSSVRPPTDFVPGLQRPITDEVPLKAGPVASPVSAAQVWRPGFVSALPNSYNNNGGAVSSAAVRHSTWNRNWIEIKMNQPASAFTDWNTTYAAITDATVPDNGQLYHMISYFWADETRDPIGITFRVPDRSTPGGNEAFTSFWLEFNTSSVFGTNPGPAYVYQRNLAILKNYILPANPLTDTFIFRKPKPNPII